VDFLGAAGADNGFAELKYLPFPAFEEKEDDILRAAGEKKTHSCIANKNAVMHS